MASEVNEKLKKSQEMRSKVMYNGERPPWKRQPSESSKAFAAYQIYQDMGVGRTLVRVIEILGCHRSNVTRWRARWSWKERALAWDEEQNRVKREALLKEVEEMGKRQARQSKNLAEALMVPVMAFLDNYDINPDILRNLPSDELFSLVARAAKEYPNIMKAERLALGEPTEEINHSGQVGLSHGLKSDIEEKLKQDPESRQLLRELYRRSRKLADTATVDDSSED